MGDDGWSDWGDAANEDTGPKKPRNNDNQGGGGGGWGDDANDDTGSKKPSNNDDQGEGERPAPYRPVELNLEDEAALQIDSVGENFKRYKDQTVTCIPLNAVNPIEKFEDVIESKLLLENVKGLKYAELTPIQKWAMPAIIGGCDLIGCAQTGSGKTAAFLLPILQTIMKTEGLSEHDPNEDCQNPYCIIISPTRELAKQIYTHSKLLSKDSLVKSCYIYGQISTAHLKAQLSRGCHILVATLGRLKDFVQRGWIGFKNVKYIILDEGDRLVDDGFSGDLKMIFEHETMPPKADRQTLFFSATFKKQVQLTAKEYLKDDFIFITVGRVGAANEDIKQEFLQVSRPDKKRELRTILKDVPENEKTIIFTQTKMAADMLAGFFNSLKLSATSIHGDRHQSQREEAIAVFKRGEKRFLISSPVGNRGLDLPKVSLVINYDLPKSIDEYVHRIGRTGRAGHIGRAISFFDIEHDRELLPDLLKILEGAKQEIPSWLKELDCPADSEPTSSGAAGTSSGGGDFGDEDWGASSSSKPAVAASSNTQAAAADEEEDWGAIPAPKPAPSTSSNPPAPEPEEEWGASSSNKANGDNNSNNNKRQAPDEAGGYQKKLDTTSKPATPATKPVQDDSEWW
uniref:RNA helicase n=1 Tax=Aceria tosichella TaxID=561515 RepID=A0A6G1SGR7_9ACAR